MNPTAILALISDLYDQIALLRRREHELLARIAELEAARPGVPEGRECENGPVVSTAAPD